MLKYLFKRINADKLSYFTAIVAMSASALSLLLVPRTCPASVQSGAPVAVLQVVLSLTLLLVALLTVFTSNARRKEEKNFLMISGSKDNSLMQLRVSEVLLYLLPVLVIVTVIVLVLSPMTSDTCLWVNSVSL